MASKNENWWEESRIVKKTKVEEYLNIDENLIDLEKQEELIRLDMNTIEFPIFSKDTRRAKNQIKVYYFKTDKSSFLEVEPMDGYSIPGEFEERVFIALTKIMRNNNYGKTFIVTANEIIKNLNLTYTGAYVSKLKIAIKTLANSMYRFKNSLYSNEINGIINDEINTTMLSIRIITRKDSDIEKIEQFEDGRVREVYKISFSDHFYKNIITKGYLVFDSEKLLEIKNSITRSIYTMIEKWRGYELYLKRPALFIARRIPLKWDKRVVGRTIKVIEKSCQELKEMGLIKHFNMIRKKNWELTEFEFIFEENHNKVKRNSFYTEKKEYGNLDMYIAHVEKRDKESESQILESDIQNDIKIIIETLPFSARKLKTMPKFIEQALKKHSFDYVKGTAEYIYTKNPKSIKGYFNKALIENWAEEYITKKESKKESKKEISKPILNNKLEEGKIIIEKRSDNQRAQLEEYFNSLSEDEKNVISIEIENAIIKKSGKMPNNVIKIMARNSSERYDILEEKRNNLKKEIIGKKERIDNELICNIEKQFSNIASFSFLILEELEKIEFSGTDKILKILKTFEFFEEEIDGYFIDIKYNSGAASYIKISRRGKNE